MLAFVFPLLTYMVAFSVFGREHTDVNSTRVEKALSVFSIVKFPNTACVSSTAGRNGTCYTSSECSANSGTASGSCASSFGVCCVFEKSCGSSSVSQNLTYFTSTSRTLGSSCSLTICKCSTDVCQLRLDFETFALNNPVTLTTGLYGGTGANGEYNLLGQCQVDTFSVSVPGGKSPPVICGTNTGYHMYVPASDQCNTMTASFGSGSSAGTGAFTIRVTQVECGSKTKSPSGCLQYHTASTGTISSFNFNAATGVHLANQDYSICIRPDRTACAICYFVADANYGLGIPNGMAAIAQKGVDTNCGAPGLAQFAKGGAFDYIDIPGGQCDSPAANAVVANILINDRYCGTDLRCQNNVDGTTVDSATVCTNQRPFKITFHTDGVEYINGPGEGSDIANSRGFELGYYMKTTCLTRPVV